MNPPKEVPPQRDEISAGFLQHLMDAKPLVYFNPCLGCDEHVEYGQLCQKCKGVIAHLRHTELPKPITLSEAVLEFLEELKTLRDAAKGGR